MTDTIPQTSASDRYEAARILLAAWDEAATPDANGCHDAGGFASRKNARIRLTLRALIIPPGHPLTVESEAVNDAVNRYDWPFHERIEISATELADMGTHLFRAGVQAAHESWEPADVPSQEFMLRHLGIEHEEQTTAGGREVIFVYQQDIEKEVD